jgi:hypothetical protein
VAAREFIGDCGEQRSAGRDRPIPDAAAVPESYGTGGHRLSPLNSSQLVRQIPIFVILAKLAGQICVVLVKGRYDGFDFLRAQFDFHESFPFPVPL